MVDNVDLQDLYRTLFNVLDGYNKTHDAQVSYVDFEVQLPDFYYAGSVICREHPQNIIDYHYRDLRDEDFDWFNPDDLQQVILNRNAIAARNRNEVQRAYREGNNISDLWFAKHHKLKPVCDVYDPVW